MIDLDSESEIDEENLENETEIESQIISAMFEHTDFIPYAINKLSVTDFKNVILRAYFSQILQLYNLNDTVITPAIVREKIDEQALNISREDFILIVNQLKYSVTILDLEEFKRLIDIKKCQSIQQSLFDFGASLLKIKLTTSNIESELNRLNSDFFSITSSWVTNVTEKTSGYLLDNFTKSASNKISSNPDNTQFSSNKYSWCLHAVNELLDGFNKEQLYILAARPGVGKTTLALNWAVALSKIAWELNSKLVLGQKKHCVLFFSLEMSSEQMFDKVISLVSFIDNIKIKKRNLSTTDWVKLNHATKNEHLDELPLVFFDDGSLSLSKIESIIREYSLNYIVDLVVIDYLQLIKVGEDRLRSNMNRTNEVSVISKTLKTMALTLKIPVLSLSQLSRRVEITSNEIKKPVLSDLKESGSIEQDADVVMFLYTDQINQMSGNENYANPTDADREALKIFFTIEKNRFGARGTKLLEFSKYCSRFEDSKDNSMVINPID